MILAVWSPRVRLPRRTDEYPKPSRERVEGDADLLEVENAGAGERAHVSTLPPEGLRKAPPPPLPLGPSGGRR
ncbi:MAG: hypothetical protein AAGA56_20175, partial [Myxococcota bacterium]